MIDADSIVSDLQDTLNLAAAFHQSLFHSL
jgi:hypothetical protein